MSSITSNFPTSPKHESLTEAPSDSNECNGVADYDEIEKSLGISEYMCPSAKGFSAVVKARYSDFVVHEVGWDGTVARLTSREIPQTDGSKKEENVEPLTDSVNSMTPAMGDWVSIQSQLQAMIQDATVAEKVTRMLEAHEDQKPHNDKFVVLPSLDKAQRTAIHNWIRESLPRARTDTLDGQVRIWHVQFETEMPNYKAFANNHNRKRGNDNRDTSNKRHKKDWPKDRPDFLQFILYKENIDTTTATKELSRKGCKARIGYAGMKDKRGITTQFCTMYRTEPHQIVGDQRTGGGNTNQRGGAVVQVGNFEFVSKEIRLGTLLGNRFDLVLRHVQTGNSDDAASHQILQNAADSMKQFGFINYFGTQRFGKYQDTHLVGIAVLQGNFQKAIDIFMSPKPDDRPDSAKARRDWQDRFLNGETADNEAAAAKRVMKGLNRFMTAENSAMQSLSRYPRDYKRAFTCIPKTLRMMFLHAVQSLVWNRAASHRITMNKTEVLTGDLVIIGNSETPEIHVVTSEDISSNRFSIVDIVLPLIGSKSRFPENEMCDLMKKLLQDLGVTVNNFKNVQDKDLALNGDYRKLLCRPTDFDFEIKEYYDPKQPLIQTDLMKLTGEDIVISSAEEGQSKKVAMIVGFTLPSSSYATVALRELMKKPTSSEYQKDLKLE